VGTWGPLAFDNDAANDWAYDLEKMNDLSLVESALDDLDGAGSDASVAVIALAACEVIARMRGKFGYENAYTEKVDVWVRAHPQSPSKALLKRARGAVARVLEKDSELRALWDGDEDWLAAVADLRRRLEG
jgi:hypothetical protein